MKQLYFQHDAHARNDSKCLELLEKFGYEGYGIYFGTLEILYEHDGIFVNNDNMLVALLPFVNKKTFKNIKEYCIKQGLLYLNNEGYLYSKRLIETIETQQKNAKERSDTGKKGNLVRWGDNRLAINDSDRLAIENNNRLAITNEIANESDNNNEINNKEKIKKEKSIFVIPSMDEICEYFLNVHKLPLAEAERRTEIFFNFYDSKNWMVGKNKMSKWTAAATNSLKWER